LLPCPPAECPERWAEASPVTHVDPTDAPMLLATGSDELVPVDQAQAMAERLDTAGIEHQLVVVPGRGHGHALRDEVWPATVSFLDKHLTRPTGVRDPNPRATPVFLVVVAIIIVGGVIGGLRVRRRLNAAAAP
ncbi:MAG TPA: prolyl oligopeptidase family serine peptidase, partial [Acidimicrobiales bacterium]